TTKCSVRRRITPTGLTAPQIVWTTMPRVDQPFFERADTDPQLVRTWDRSLLSEPGGRILFDMARSERCSFASLTYFLTQSEHSKLILQRPAMPRPSSMQSVSSQTLLGKSSRLQQRIHTGLVRATTVAPVWAASSHAPLTHKANYAFVASPR